MVDLYHDIGVNLGLDLPISGTTFFLIICTMGILVRKTILNPIKLVSTRITNVTMTGNFSEKLPKRANDEIGQLIGAFNDLMEELGRKTLQTRESEERYRKFIEMAKSAVITFMEDGKIAIMNQKAEELFGLSQQALLGDYIFKFMEDVEEFREALIAEISEGKTGGVQATTRHKIRNFQGRSVEVEMTLSASSTGQSPMFTAIL
jgi:PAS domain S-box-containing protein